MIIKVLEEMRQLRLDNDFYNYRTLVNVMKDYVTVECLCVNINKIDIKQLDLIKTIIKWLESEIVHINERLNYSLVKKDYKNFKMISQSDIVLKHMCNRLKEISAVI